MRIFLSLLIAILSSTTFRGEDMPSDVHQSSAVPAEARFQIVQSELAARFTYRLDRFTGKVCQLVKTKSDDYVWEDVPVTPKANVANPNHPRFTIFLSGLAARFTFLIDTDTGKTWQIEKSTTHHADGTDSDEYAWVALAE
jgi:hypothetical protein